MSHTAEEIQDGINEHHQLTRFVQGAMMSKAPMRVCSKLAAKECAVWLPRDWFDQTVEHATERMRALEKQFGIKAAVIGEVETEKTPSVRKDADTSPGPGEGGRTK